MLYVLFDLYDQFTTSNFFQHGRFNMIAILWNMVYVSLVLTERIQNLLVIFPSSVLSLYLDIGCEKVKTRTSYFFMVLLNKDHKGGLLLLLTIFWKATIYLLILVNQLTMQPEISGARPKYFTYTNTLIYFK